MWSNGEKKYERTTNDDEYNGKIHRNQQSNLKALNDF